MNRSCHQHQIEIQRRFSTGTPVVDRSSIKSVPGKATPEGTKRFTETSKLPLYHVFANSNLTVNPIIVGPPKDANGEFMEANHSIKHCILQNRSNCVFVSNFEINPNGNHKVWWTTEVNQLLQNGMVQRDEIVTVANLGTVTDRDEIVERIVLTSELCGLEELDAVVIKIDKQFFTHHENRKSGRIKGPKKKIGNIVELVQVLEKICSSKNLHFYGIHADFPPYSYHTPPIRSMSDYMGTPRAIEESMQTEMKYGDFMLYQISPSTALPATYVMLDPGRDWADVYREEDSDTPDGVPLLCEATRTFTRGSLDPLLCYPGRAPMSHDRGEGTFLSQGDMAAVNKRLSRVLSKEEERYKAENHGELPSLEADEGGNDMPRGDFMNEHLSEEIENNGDFKDGVGRAKMNIISVVEDGVDESGDNNNHDNSIPLLSGILPAKAERKMGESLNNLCPHLVTSPRLEDKALRLIFSVGVDVMVVDAISCAVIGKLAVRPSDLLPIAATEKIFGNFMIENPADVTNS